MSFRGGDGCSLEVFLFCFGCFDVFQSHDFYVSKRKPSFKKKEKKKLSGLLLPRKVCIALRKLDVALSLVMAVAMMVLVVVAVSQPI